MSNLYNRGTSAPISQNLLQKICLIIAVCGIGFFTANYATTQYSEMLEYDIVMSVIVVGMGFVVAYCALNLAVRYHGRRYLGVSFLFLSAGFMAYAVSELVWVHNVYMGLETYPNPFIDGLYFCYFALALLHVGYTIRHFGLGQKQHLPNIIIAGLVGALVAGGTYAVTSNGVEEFDFFYGLPFVILAGGLFGASGFVLFKLRCNLVTWPWMFIGTAIMMASGVDIYYYILENVGLYQYGNIADTLWFVTDIIMIIGLYMYRKAI